MPLPVPATQDHHRRTFGSYALECEKPMAHHPSKIGNLIETFWSLLRIACIGLAAAHVMTSACAQSIDDNNLIEQTFTTASNTKPER